MLVKLGVDVSRLLDPIRRIQNRVDRVYKKYTGQEAVVSSTYEGDHSPSSFHYVNLAEDIRKPDIQYIATVKTKLKEAVGDDYDVVDERDHFHIEYDPD